MERSVEARDLRQLRQAFEQCLYRRQIIGLMQRGEWNVLFQRGHHRRIDANGLRVLETPVHDAMADTDEAITRQVLAQERDQVIERTGMAERDAFSPRLFVDHRARMVFGDEARRRVQALGLSPRNHDSTIGAFREQRKLEARRARVQNGNCIGHVSAPRCRR